MNNILFMYVHKPYPMDNNPFTILVDNREMFSQQNRYDEGRESIEDSSQGLSPWNGDSVGNVSPLDDARTTERSNYDQLGAVIDKAHARGLLTVTEVAKCFVEDPDNSFKTFIATFLHYSELDPVSNMQFFSRKKIDDILGRFNNCHGRRIPQRDYDFAERLLNYVTQVNTQLRPKFSTEVTFT